MVIETFQYFCLFQKFFPISSHLFPIISFMATVSSLKRALSVGPNEPRPGSSYLMILHERIWVTQRSLENETFFGGTMEL